VVRADASWRSFEGLATDGGGRTIAAGADGSGGQYARLCYSFPDPDRISEGIRRLASVIESEIQLRDDFAPSTSDRS